jgi:hypothetical protein
MNPNERTTMGNTTANKRLLALASWVLVAGCGPTFDPASLIEGTRVIGARIEVDGAPERASPKPGETADVSWLVTSPDVTPPLRWTFAVCMPGNGSLTCGSAPLALFDGADTPPRIALAVPGPGALGTATSVTVYGQICAGADSVPLFDPQQGVPSCSGGAGTTVSLSVPLQLGDEPNHNPTADRAFTLDGQAWAAGAAGDDPCAVGPRLSGGSKDHVIGNLTDGGDREGYTALEGSPLVPTQARETLQISQFATAGKLKSQFSFVEGTDQQAATVVDVTWQTPEAAAIPTGGLAVTFTFVIRDNRGGTDWTTRALCVTQ